MTDRSSGGRQLQVDEFQRDSEREQLVLEDFVPYLLNQVTNRLNHGMREHLRAYRTTIPQWRVLCLLSLHGPLSIGMIESRTVIAQSTVSRVIDQLERRGLVVRRPRPGNNRVVEVHVTRNGRETFNKIVPSALEVRDEVVATISPTERATLTRLLKKLLAALRERPAYSGV